jgi:hypothetical protein
MVDLLELCDYETLLLKQSSTFMNFLHVIFALIFYDCNDLVISMHSWIGSSWAWCGGMA